MPMVFARARAAFAAAVFALLVPGLYAQSERPAGMATDPAPPPAGDFDLGLLIIIGAIGFFILVAWLFSRTGDDGGRGPDRNLL